MSKEVAPASTGKASAPPPTAMGSRGPGGTGSAAAFLCRERSSPTALLAAMGSRGPGGTGSATAFMGRGSRSPAAPNSSHSAMTFFPAGPGRGCISSGWGYARSGGSSHGRDPFTSSPSSSGFPIPPSPCPAWCEAIDVDNPSNWDPTRDKEPYPPGGFMAYFGNQPHNFHLVGAAMSTTLPNTNAESSPTDCQILGLFGSKILDGTLKKLEIESSRKMAFFMQSGSFHNVKLALFFAISYLLNYY